MIEEGLRKGPEQLKREVLAGGWCVSCGACAELCPYIKAVGDRVAVTHACGLNEGNCYVVCPRTLTDYQALAEEFTACAVDPALGGFVELCQARAIDLAMRGSAQYGGAVTALVSLALEAGLAGAALLTSSDGLYPRWVMARTRQEVVAAAGTKYGLCPGLSGLNRALRQGSSKVAVVGRPCQATALRKMQRYSTVEGREEIGPVIGLFCFWGLDYSIYRYLQEKHGVGRIERADIPKGSGLTLETDKGPLTMSLEETRAFIKPGCHSCIDPTAELADISVGSTESDPCWCTLLVRTARGATLMEAARKAGVLETRPVPEPALSALKSAALSKKRRVLGAPASGEGEHAVNNAYIRLAEESRRRIGEEEI